MSADRRIAAAAIVTAALAVAGCGPKISPNCTAGTNPGSVTIDSEDDLRKMIGCVHVQGHMLIERTPLTNLAGLESLTTVDGYVSILWNDALTDVSGLANLTSVGGGHVAGGSAFNVGDNPMLIDASFPGLTSLAGELTIGGTGQTNISFSALTSIGGGLFISGTTSLTTLAGVQTVTSIGGNLIIQRNAALTDTSALSALTAVPADLMVSENPALKTLSLPAVASVGATGPSPTSVGPSSQQLYISMNPLLTAIDLPALTFVGPGGVRIYNNGMLPPCQADAIANAVSQPCNCAGNTGPATCN